MNRCGRGCSKYKLFWKARVFCHPPFHRDQCTGGEHGDQGYLPTVLCRCLRLLSSSLLGAAETKMQNKSSRKWKSTFTDTFKNRIYVRTRTCVLWHDSHGDTAALQTTPWGDGRDGAADYGCELGLEKAFPSVQFPVQPTLACGFVCACPAKAALVQGLQGNWWGMRGLFRSTPWAHSRAGRSPGPAHWDASLPWREVAEALSGDAQWLIPHV